MLDKQAFDLIIMDAQMPVMNGLETTRHIRGNGIETPIVALSGNSGVSDMEQFRTAGCNEYLTKPIKREQLVRVCKLFLPDAGKNAPSQSPLYSTLLEEDPDLIDIVEGFVKRYPDMLAQLSKLLDTNQLDEFQTKVHELKGSGGNVGYLEITNLCSQIEFQLNTGNRDEIQHLMDKLANLHPRMSLALPSSSKLTH
jgi:CheY-like chemotaxis protein